MDYSKYAFHYILWRHYKKKGDEAKRREHGAIWTAEHNNPAMLLSVGQLDRQPSWKRGKNEALEFIKSIKRA